jgi:hypothetical protein
MATVIVELSLVGFVPPKCRHPAKAGGVIENGLILSH